MEIMRDIIEENYEEPKNQDSIQLGLHQMPKNMLLIITRFLMIEDLRKITAVCKSLHHYVNSPDFWEFYFYGSKNPLNIKRNKLTPSEMSSYIFKCYALSQLPVDGVQATSVSSQRTAQSQFIELLQSLNRQLVQQFHVNDVVQEAQINFPQVPLFQEPQGVQETFQRIVPKRRIPLSAVWSTSEDNSQSIDDTLSDKSQLFWSSLGIEGADDRDEVLFYEVKEGCALITGFQLFFYQAHYLVNKVYPCRIIRFEVGLTSQELNYREDFELKANELTAEVCPIRLLKKAVIGRVVKITLIGRVTRQETDNIFYFAVERVIVAGSYFDESQRNGNAIEEQQKTECVTMDGDEEDDDDDYEDIDSNEEESKIQEEEKEKEEEPKLNVGNNSLEKRLNMSSIYNLMVKNGDLDSSAIQNALNDLKTSGNLQLFNTCLELRSNEEAYRFLASQDESVISKYLRDCAQNTRRLSILETVLIVSQIVNFQAIILLMNELIVKGQEQKSKNIEVDTKEMITDFLTKLQGINIFQDKTYEGQIWRFQYFTLSNKLFKSLFVPFAEYFKFSENDTSQSYKLAMSRIVFSQQENTPSHIGICKDKIRLSIIPTFFAIIQKQILNQ